MNDIEVEPFTLAGADGRSIHGTHWRPEGKVDGVVQIFHGLGEHHQRYGEFAALASARGLAVVAHDHRGHGQQTQHAGHFSDQPGWNLLTADGLRVNDMIGDLYTRRPIVLLGHSMGSYIAQHFSRLHDCRLTALVLSASTWPVTTKLIAGQLIALIETLRLGRRGKSRLLDKLGFGDFNKPFSPARTEYDWLSRDNARVDAYLNDPLCGGPYSCGLWRDLLAGLKGIASEDALRAIRSDLPILLTGGADDPVGGQHGITQLAMHYIRSGHTSVTAKIYPQARHEMFNETNRDQFCADVLNWIEVQLPSIAGV